MRHDESFDLPYTLPFPLPLRLEDTLEGGKNLVRFCFADATTDRA